MKPTKPKLKPCPFCGGTDIVIAQTPEFPSGGYMLCRGCYATTRSGIYTDEAVANWNRRVDDTPHGDCVKCMDEPDDHMTREELRIYKCQRTVPLRDIMEAKVKPEGVSDVRWRIELSRRRLAAKHQFREVTKTIPREEVVVSKMETTTPTYEKSSQVGNTPPRNIDRINNYDEMVSAWNGYVRAYHGSINGFFTWLFIKTRGDVK